MAGAKKSNGDDTGATMSDAVRELRSLGATLADHTKLLASIDQKIDTAIRKDHAFEARISKLETDKATLKRKRG